MFRALKKACVSAIKAWCRPFTCMLVDKLPCELRDMVLEHLLKPERDQAILSTHIINEWKLHEGYPERWVQALFQDPYPPYFAYPDCVDERFALEAAETLYRVALVRVTDVTQLEEILPCDVLSTACVPSAHIRSIEIGMHVPQNSPPAPHYHGPHKLEYAKFIDHVAPIFKIKRIKGLRVRLVIDCSREWLPLGCFAKFKEVLAPTIHRLFHSGAQVVWFHKIEKFAPVYAMNMPGRGPGLRREHGRDNG
jgi:hypothetical protein